MGYPTADRLMDEWDAQDVADWQTFLSIEPDAETRADARHGILSMLLAKVWGGNKDCKASDFIPRWEPEPPKKPQTLEEAIMVVKKINAMMGGTFHDSKGRQKT